MENVNKQVLDAAKLVLQQAERNLAAINLPVLEKLTAAIAAAEQAQHVKPRCACGDSFTSDAVCANCLTAQKQAEPVAWKLFKQALFVGMECDCLHYLMANAHGRRDGALKAKNHEDLCRHIVAAVRGCNPDVVRRHHEDDYQAVHDGTQALTDYLDEVIGFPLWSRPDYDDLTPKFFDKFFELAMAALGVSPATQPPAVAVPAEMTPDMMRAVQLRSELGAYAAANLSGAYDLFSDFWRVAVEEAQKSGA